MDWRARRSPMNKRINPARIAPMLRIVEWIWRKHPALRLGQILYEGAREPMLRVEPDDRLFSLLVKNFRVPVLIALAAEGDDAHRSRKKSRHKARHPKSSGNS